jgi:hypothetical protein
MPAKSKADQSKANPSKADQSEDPNRREPTGFTPSSSGPASERAREQGWQTNEEERTQTPLVHQPIDGGTDYDYGARDFGDLPEDTSSAPLPPNLKKQPAFPSDAAGPEKKRKNKAA